NLPVLAFTAALSIAAGLLFGLAPALKAGRHDLATALRTRGEGGGSHLRKGLAPMLVVAQVALSLVLLVGSGLLARSLMNLSRAEVGFARDGVVLVDIDTRIAGLQPAELSPYYQRLVERIRAVPGVRAATVATYSPMSGTSRSSSLVVEGFTAAPGEDVLANVNQVAPQFVETLGIPLVKGRQFDERDSLTAPKVAFVNEAFARAYFAHRDPIGMHVGFGSEPKDATIEIVGVVGDAKYDNPRDAPERMLFLPLLQQSDQSGYASDLEIRTSIDPDGVVPAVRRAIAEVDARVPIADVSTLARQVADSVRADFLLAQLVGAFSLLALVLACVGLYGVVSQSVARRTNEVGIRMALGAGRGDILGMLMREAGVLILAGLAIGLPGALLGSRLLMSLLFGITPADPLTLLGSAGLLLAVAVLAGFIPARRASRVEPLVSLRAE
ncbi:MAG TPA: FtsX-like permease family protein, partial [Candidatus Polarisedimenticolia bacterium]|nr:FtsX-like permease family protein [Candidatus Polarisedimenticolia bacterium]